LKQKAIHRTLRVFHVLGLVLATAPSLAAEELILKNGEKVVGTIVGYEGDMFRVQTEYGFALIKKDKVASIGFEKGGGGEASAKGGESRDVGPGASPTVKSQESAASATRAASKSPPPVSRPLVKPLPANIQERVEGTRYVNETFQFAMYKPPGWKIHEEVSRETGRAIVAIATEDERTLLIVDRQVWSGPPDLHSGAVVENLQQPYLDFSKESESPAQLDGRAAIQRQFTGLMDGVEWHGVAVHVARGNTLFGIIGLTSAETYEFQQAIFGKIIKSFHFLGGTAEATATP